MKSKQTCPKSVRPSSTNSNHSIQRTQKQPSRCSICHSLLKPSNGYRYLLVGKSTNEKFNENMTYGDCYRTYLDSKFPIDKVLIFCPKCCDDLNRIHSLKTEAEKLNEKLRQALGKTQRLPKMEIKRLRFNKKFKAMSSVPKEPINILQETVNVPIKKEIDQDESLSSNNFNFPSNFSTNTDQQNEQETLERFNSTTSVTSDDRLNSSRKLTMSSPNKRKTKSMFSMRLNSQISQKSQKFDSPSMTNSSPSPYAQLLIESPSSSSRSPIEPSNISRRSSSNSEKIPTTIPYGLSIDEERSMSPTANDDDGSLMNESKTGRLSRRQYDFLIKLPDQNSLNTYIENSSAGSGSRWTWRRTSANSRGYKVYYVCNFSMRRHYHPCPAAMYALFHPEGSISIYSCGEHKHIPKDRLPVSITDATKDEIFRCLQNGMATTDIRERLTRLQLPFGDARKLNNFIKYHKELLRFGTVTNVRIGGTAYRQPQCWAIRRQTSSTNSTAQGNNEDQKSS